MTRRRLILAAMALPAITAAVLLVSLEVWRAVHPASALFEPAAAQTLAEAIDRQDLHQAYAFFVAGHHVDAPIEVEHRVLTGGRTLRVSPLVWAVATRNAGAVQMLLGLGARLDSAIDRRTPCLAEAVGDAELAAMLRRYLPADATRTCPARPAGEAPLVAFLSQ